MRTYLGVTLAAAAASLVNVSCQQVECGQGTVERDGTCVPADEATNPSMCGGMGPFATVLGLDGKCETEEPTICDDDTTEPSFDDQTGVTTCVGTGGGCMEEIRCPAPEAGRATLCGRIWDSETDQPIPPEGNGTNTDRCDPMAPTTSGPCSLRLRFFDALDFAMNPSGAVPIMPMGGVYTDNCNRYKGENMPRATFGFIGIAVDDAPGITPTVPHRLTGVATSNALASPGQGFRAYITKVSTDMMWTTTSGIGGAQTFAQRGVLGIVFHYPGEMPRSGVRIRRSGSFIPQDDFYFSDAGRMRTTVMPHVGNTDATGMNGTGLVINSDTPIAHDGVGSEPNGCIWPSNLAASIPGVVFMQIKEAETPAGAACP